jgi:hypothetical protein
MSAPLVAGAAALLLEAAPALGPPELGRILEVSAWDLAPAGRDNSTGAGRLDIPAALAEVTSLAADHFWIHNDGPFPLVIDRVACEAVWLQVAPASLILAPGDSARFTVAFDPSGYGVGAYHTDLTITSNDPTSPHGLHVVMIIGDLSGVGSLPVNSPMVSSLKNYPNPFNPRTWVQFENPAAGRVRLAIFDLKGRVVRHLLETDLPAGTHEVLWDGRSDEGRAVASGTYLVVLSCGSGWKASHKLVLLR